MKVREGVVVYGVVIGILISGVLVGAQLSADPITLAVSGRKAFYAGCRSCHTLDRPLNLNKDAAGWDRTVARMIGKSPSSFKPGDKEAIVTYLTAKSLFESSCKSCHSLERSWEVSKNRDGWTETVTRMQRYAKGSIDDSSALMITGYLVAERPSD